MTRIVSWKSNNTKVTARKLIIYIAVCNTEQSVCHNVLDTWLSLIDEENHLLILNDKHANGISLIFEEILYQILAAHIWLKLD